MPVHKKKKEKKNPHKIRRWDAEIMTGVIIVEWKNDSCDMRA